jgi:hypothetical protein
LNAKRPISHLGSNDPDIVGELADDLFQRQDAERVDASRLMMRTLCFEN